ncbi:retinoblastoma-like protein 1 [Anabrus simplex]|uniref:retinoblastoma-like protein 1 n=1 Tax=Anabrus simplex TaxID=316456 RepID=UPI0035A2FCC3
MGLLDDPDDNIFKRHQELCTNLNMDKDAADQAWHSYETIRQNYTLEGDQLHWLGCALYVACRRTTIPVVGRSGTMVEGNCVSLTRLLRLCKLSLIQFFNKSKKWADMASMPPEFRSKIDRLERNFAVSMVIFKKFQPIFLEMFNNPADSLSRTPRSRKQRSSPCTPSKVFDFCWTLFVCVKGEFTDISDDLVNSYHLLLACCDLIFANALLADRRDILNPDFQGLPSDFYSPDYVKPTEPPCIIDHLCQSHDGIAVEAKGIKEYCWKSHIRKLFDKKILRGDAATLSGILEPSYFDANCKAINRTYEEYVLSVGDFDERIFLAECRRLQALPEGKRCHLISALIYPEKRPALRVWNSQSQGEDASTDIGSPTKMCGMGEFKEKLQAKKNLLVYGIQQHLAPSTPLTGRRYLSNKENNQNITPVSTATQSVSRLQSLLAGRHSSPSETLSEIFSSCSRNPREKVEELVKGMGQMFCTHYTHQSDDQTGSPIDFAQKRLQLAESLFYKLLENILVEERNKKPPGFDFSALLEQDIFHQTLFACCLEIVIYSYNSQRSFPWVLEALNLEPYYFYKVIEIIVRVEDQLSRDMVKHLNLIEEQILESMAWRSESPLWENIQSSGLPVPSCEDVSLPAQLDESMSSVPYQNPVIRRITSGDRSLPVPNNPQSPVTSVSDRFQSPVPANSLAKKRLFQGEGSLPNSKPPAQPVKPGQSVLQSSTKPMAVNIQTVEGENGQRYIPISYVPGAGSVIIQAQPSANNNSAKQQQPQGQQPPQPQAVNKDKKPRRACSLGLFFRKFYHLASVRMQELCTQLDLTDMELRRKIWTCFEHSIIHQTNLMQDRHLDQILMCAVYVICKVAQTEKTFTEIMRCYRLQPQAASHVYRSVLLSTKRRRGSGSSSNGTSNTSSPVPSDTENKDEPKDPIRSSSTLPVTQPPSAPPTPTHLAGTSTSFEFEERGDLIKFYNTVYVKEVQGFAVKFSPRNQSENLTLSPLPLGKNRPLSPCRRISEKHPVFIRALEHKGIPTSPTQPLSYCFSRSPAKDLRAINNMIQIDAKKIGKRLLVDDIPDSDSPPAKQPTTPVVARKIQDIIGDRMGHVQD